MTVASVEMCWGSTQEAVHSVSLLCIVLFTVGGSCVCVPETHNTEKQLHSRVSSGLSVCVRVHVDNVWPL